MSTVRELQSLIRSRQQQQQAEYQQHTQTSSQYRRTGVHNLIPGLTPYGAPQSTAEGDNPFSRGFAAITALDALARGSTCQHCGAQRGDVSVDTKRGVEMQPGDYPAAFKGLITALENGASPESVVDVATALLEDFGKRFLPELTQEQWQKLDPFLDEVERSMLTGQPIDYNRPGVAEGADFLQQLIDDGFFDLTISSLARQSKTGGEDDEEGEGGGQPGSRTGCMKGGGGGGGGRVGSAKGGGRLPGFGRGGGDPIFAVIASLMSCYRSAVDEMMAIRGRLESLNAQASALREQIGGGENKAAQNQLSNVGEDRQLVMIDLQAALQRVMQIMQALTNTLKVSHETVMAVARNLK